MKIIFSRTELGKAALKFLGDKPFTEDEFVDVLVRFVEALRELGIESYNVEGEDEQD